MRQNKDDIDVSVILATYNEAENIENLILEILNYIQSFTSEIIVVDDDSIDLTWSVVMNLQAIKPNIKLIRRIGQKGLASAIVDGINISRGKYIVWLDCDFSHPPNMMKKMIENLKEYDIVIASRFVEGGANINTTKRIISSQLINLFANMLFFSSIKDYTSGYLAVKREVLDKVKIQPLLGERIGWIIAYGEYFISFIHRAKNEGYKIKEMPYLYYPRTRGVTKTSPNNLHLIKLGVVYGLTILVLFFFDLYSCILNMNGKSRNKEKNTR